MPNYDGQLEVRLFYEVPIGTQTLQHRHTFDVKYDGNISPGTPWDEINLLDRTGVERELANFVATYLGLVKALYSVTSTFTYGELWQFEPDGNDGIFISANAFNVAGTVTVQPIRAAGQVTHTYRTLAGGLGKMVYMETTVQRDTRVAYVPLTGAEKALMTFVSDEESIIVARDDYPMYAPIASSAGENEALFRKRFRSS